MIDKYYEIGDVVEKYYVLKIIGEGRYGIAYLVEDTNLNKYVLKQLKTDMSVKVSRKLFYEVEILKLLNDSRFPKFVERFDYDDKIFYVLEYIDGKDFETILSEEEYKFNKEEIYNIAEQLIEIVYTLECKGIIHRDIRTPNIILDENNKIRLIDFGLARYIDEEKHLKEIDYWYIADFLIHLYYTSYFDDNTLEEKPWFEELDISEEEKLFLKRLMGIDSSYNNIDEIKQSLENIRKSEKKNIW